jgi:hypothetical protein
MAEAAYFFFGASQVAHFSPFLWAEAQQAFSLPGAAQHESQLSFLIAAQDARLRAAAAATSVRMRVMMGV